MKKLLSLITVLFIVAMVLAGCSSPPDVPSSAQPAPEQPAAAAPEPVPDPIPEETPEPETTPEPTPEAPVEPEGEPYEITYSFAKVWTNSIDTTWVQTIIEVTNIGTEALFLSSGAYDLEMPDGTLVASRDMVSAYPSVIAPGEKGYYYEETTLDEGDPGAELTVVPRVDVDIAKVDHIRYALSDIALSDGDFIGLEVLGRIENTSDEAESMVYIAFVMYDESDTPIGMIFTILTEELAPGAKIGFEASSFSLPDDVTEESVARYEAFAYPLQMQF